MSFSKYRKRLPKVVIENIIIIILLLFPGVADYCISVIRVYVVVQFFFLFTLFLNQFKIFKLVLFFYTSLIFFKYVTLLFYSRGVYSM